MDCQSSRSRSTTSTLARTLMGICVERMNTLLANGEVPGLFEGDELTTLMTQCEEEAQREGTVRSAATWKSNSYI